MIDQLRFIVPGLVDGRTDRVPLEIVRGQGARTSEQFRLGAGGGVVNPEAGIVGGQNYGPAVVDVDHAAFRGPSDDYEAGPGFFQTMRQPV